MGTRISPRMNFADMLRAILERTEIEKLRISSVEPMDWTNEVIELVAARRASASTPMCRCSRAATKSCGSAP